MSKDVNDILQEGIYGVKEINPAERRKFLGTLRERVLAVLSTTQVKESGTYKEIEELMAEHPKVKLILNGELSYHHLSDYIKLANKHNLSFTISSNLEHETDIGLVLAYDYAIDQEDIYIDTQQNSSG
ncbi:YueI family protein [Calidifontibacillus oryziterrae]|uniref:YueI family protein n=1 Tax=Calidifontibacillus oryziterrae TaxID=1191699 RepID=UPI0002E22B91|nr:YueI family protein [Calidifontibacillus oryziterrae]